MSCVERRSFVKAHVDRELLKLEYCKSQVVQSRVMLTAVQNVIDGMVCCDGAWCKDILQLCRVALDHARINLFVTLEAKILKEEALETILEEYEHRGYISVTRTYG